MSDHPSTLSPEESLYGICLLAAFADRSASEAERQELKQIGESILPPEMHPAALYQKVLLRKIDATSAAAGLDSQEWRQLAYEMAVCVCEADGQTCPEEKEFLRQLGKELKLDSARTETTLMEADALAAAPIAAIATEQLPVIAPPFPSGPAQAEVDSLVLRFSILNAALELLPETLSTMAIVPLQMKLVHSVGKLHGVDLDRRHIGEFIAAAGIGATSQIVEGFARKLLGGLAGGLGKKMLGKTAGSLGKTAVNQITSSAFSFGSTYAIGHLAQRYYGNGRSWAGLNPKQAAESLRNEAQNLHTLHLPQIREQAANLDLGKVMAMVRGQ
ncbi:TerB family tellurite resistance protein [Akkermansiaceae bacterium]|nr:TerB family tellurite resistance protein [Akkermansiaceae bacterium]